jgi:hypothetical protein
MSLALLSELLDSERLCGRHDSLDRQAVYPSTLLHKLVDEAFAGMPVQLDPDPAGT